MRRLTVRSGRSLIYLMAATALLAPSPATAAEEADQGKLPVKRVVLFNSGVGFFEHLGQVDDDDKVDLRFRVDDINDLLKSMVLQDLGGGKISTISYGSRDPITKTLKTFAVDLTTNPTLADLLGQLRGEKIEIDAPNPVTGTILGVEHREQRIDDKQTVKVAYVNLLTAEGLRSVSLENVGRIKLLNAEVDAELREALKILAMSHDTDKKTVTLNFLGQGKRPVRVGYIQESPVWKTSYRLVLDDEEPPFLQGWAIVENTTESDWKDVALTLVSGRPISFIMDLYSPLYASRPTVEPELYASLRPQTYDQDLAARDREFRKAGEGGRPVEEKAKALAAAAPGSPAADGRQLARRGADKRDALLREGEQADANFDLKQGVKSLAEAQDVGELFQYAIATPVSLQRQRSAMLPIVNDSIKGEKLSIYNSSVHPKHPLNGLKLVNSSGLHLMQGPVTVFDGGIYAGDARFPDLPPGTERLVSYAMDLDVEVAPTMTNRPEELVNVKLVKGTLYTSRKFAREQKYLIKNSGKKAKNVLIEYAIDPNWQLVTPKEPKERARGVYRFEVEAKPGEPTELKVEEQMISNQQFAITNLDDGAIVFYINAKVVSEPIKKALQEVIKRKAAIQQLVAQRQQLEQQVAVIGQEQERIRKNMAELPKNSDLFTRYIKKFTDQEDEIEKLRKQIADLAAKEAEQRKALDAYLLGLDLS